MKHQTRKNTKEKSKDKFYEALLLTNGLVTLAANNCGINRGTHYKWMNEDPVYREKVESIKQDVLDKAKDCLLRSIEQGNSQDAKWYIQYLGKTGDFDYNKNELADNQIEIIVRRKNKDEE